MSMTISWEFDDRNGPVQGLGELLARFGIDYNLCSASLIVCINRPWSFNPKLLP